MGLTPTGFKQTWRVSSARFGMVCMCPQQQLPPKGPSSAHILHGLCATVCQILSHNFCAFNAHHQPAAAASMMQFRMGFHALPVEHGRLAMARLAIPSISTAALCLREITVLQDERRCIVDCPHFAASINHSSQERELFNSLALFELRPCRPQG